MFGTNDSTWSLHWDEAAFESDYLELIDSFAKLDSAPEIFLMVPPPIFTDFPYFDKEAWGDLSHVNGGFTELIGTIAAKSGLPANHVIDLHASLDNSGLFWDGVHPNSEGYAVVSSLVRNALESAVAKRLNDKLTFL